MSINNIINIDIKTQSLQLAQKGFGVPLILGYHENFIDPDAPTDPEKILVKT